MDARHYKNPPAIPRQPRLRVVWNGTERRFETEAEAEAFAEELRIKGENQCVCSF